MKMDKLTLMVWYEMLNWNKYQICGTYRQTNERLLWYTMLLYLWRITHRPTLVIIGDLYENKINTVDKTIRL